MTDISEYVLSGRKASESDVEDDEDAQIDLVQAVKGELNRKMRGKKRSKANDNKGAIRLQELGPRVEMTLAKIQTGFCEGELMWHWQGLEAARLKEQRKKRLALGDKAPSDFPGLQQIRKAELAEQEAEARAEREEREKEKREKAETARRREAKRAAKSAKRAAAKAGVPGARKDGAGGGDEGDGDEGDGDDDE